MRSIEVEITGVSPLLMHRFSEEARNHIESRSSDATGRPDKEQVAERGAYRMNGRTDSNLYVPAENLMAAMRRGAGYHKLGRRSAVAAVSGGVFVTPDRLDLGTTRYAIDSRSVVIPSTKGRVMQHRPRLDSWKLRFKIEYNERLFADAEILHKILEDTGQIVGLGAFRPEKRGPFGRFVVTAWKC